MRDLVEFREKNKYIQAQVEVNQKTVSSRRSRETLADISDVFLGKQSDAKDVFKGEYNLKWLLNRLYDTVCYGGINPRHSEGHYDVVRDTKVLNTIGINLQNALFRLLGDTESLSDIYDDYQHMTKKKLAKFCQDKQFFDVLKDGLGTLHGHAKTNDVFKLFNGICFDEKVSLLYTVSLFLETIQDFSKRLKMRILLISIDAQKQMCAFPDRY